MKRVIMSLIIAILLRILITVLTDKPYPVEILDNTDKINNIHQIQEETFKQLEYLNEEIEKLKPDNTIPLSLELQHHLKRECENYKVNIEEAIAIMLVENPTVNPELVNKNTNGTIDVGLFQINSCRFKQFEKMGLDNLKDPKQNITAGVSVIASLNKYNGELKYIAYNSGEGGMKKLVNRGISSNIYSRKVMNKLNERRKGDE